MYRICPIYLHSRDNLSTGHLQPGLIVSQLVYYLCLWPLPVYSLHRNQQDSASPPLVKIKSHHDIFSPNTLQRLSASRQGEKDKVLTIIYKALLIRPFIHFLSSSAPCVCPSLPCSSANRTPWLFKHAEHSTIWGLFHLLFCLLGIIPSFRSVKCHPIKEGFSGHILWNRISCIKLSLFFITS